MTNLKDFVPIRASIPNPNILEAVRRHWIRLHITDHPLTADGGIHHSLCNQEINQETQWKKDHHIILRVGRQGGHWRMQQLPPEYSDEVMECEVFLVSVPRSRKY